MSKTEIQWTDQVWNPTTGCDRVSAGCDHCYALTLAKRLKAMGNPRYQVDGNPKTSGPGFGVTLHPDKLTDPLRWRKPQKIFVNSMSDLFHAQVPDSYIAAVFVVMALAQAHTFQILTKRPQRMERFMRQVGSLSRIDFEALAVSSGALPERLGQYIHTWWRRPSNPLTPGYSWPLPNVWLGTSVENQEAAYRIDWLVRTPAAVRFLSCEPLIGPLDLSRWICPTTITHDDDGEYEESSAIDWVITGGESGPGFRSFDPSWAASIRDLCLNAGVAYFHKQNGGIRSKAGGRELDGRTWDQMPEVA